MMSSGRNPNGRFAPGNKGGPGNPHAAKVAELRSALLEAVTPEDIAEVVGSLLTQAKAGDIAAAKVLFDRCLGRVALADVGSDSDDEPQVGWWEGIAQGSNAREELVSRIAALAARREDLAAGSLTSESLALMMAREAEPGPGN